MLFTITRWILLWTFMFPVFADVWTFSDDGWATLTHYDLPTDYIASCGCTGKSTHYPTVALSTLAFGSNTSYGPSCGRCMNLTLLNTLYSDPIWYPNPTKWIVVKVTDMCPGPGLCGATPGNPNSVGAYLNFDLAYPSSYLKDGWYPKNISAYGDVDFGVWNVSYASVSCRYWAGWYDKAALGSPKGEYPSMCCPNDPLNESDRCPSFSAQPNTWPPDTTTSSANVLSVGIASCLAAVLALTVTVTQL